VCDCLAITSATDVAAADRRGSITPVQSARDLGIYVDCDLSMQTRPMYSVVMLRHALPATSDPSLCAISHTADAHGCTGALPAGL